jgi:hypothetical protein
MALKFLSKIKNERSFEFILHRAGLFCVNLPGNGVFIS